jgi:hypothetical protein
MEALLRLVYLAVYEAFNQLIYQCLDDEEQLNFSLKSKSFNKDVPSSLLFSILS